MWVKRVLLAIVVITFAASFGAKNARAQAWPQWQLTGGFLGGNVTAMIYLDPIHGVVAVSGRICILFYPVISWQPANMPTGINSIRALRLIQGILYAATNADLIVSTDSGRNWKFSGLGLTNANDVYADGTGNIRILTNPMKVFARLDTMHCIAQGNGNIYVSNDGGVTWGTSGVTMVDAASTGAFADPCHNVYVCPNSWGTAFRSTDFGITWNTVLTGSGPQSEYLAGASVTSYISSQGGMYRSTDDGLHWKSVITVSTGPYPSLYVFGPMGEHVVVQNGSFFMTTTGGLDDLHSGPNMTDSNGMPLMQDDTFNVPLQMISTCNLMRIPIPFHADVDGLSEKMSILNDSLGDFSLLARTSIDTLRRGNGDTLWLLYDPHHPVSNVVLKFDNHWECSSWSETRTVHVVAIPTAQLMPPPTLASSCMADTEAAYLKLDSCQTIVVDSVLIPGRVAARLSFVHSLPDTVRLGHGDSLLFRFDATDTIGTFSDSVEVFAHFPGMDSALAFFDWRWFMGNDTAYGSLTSYQKKIPVRMLALPGVALITRDSVLSLARPILCSRLEDTLATFINKGCTPDTITQIAIAGAGFTLPNVTLPIIVQPGKLLSIPIEFGAPDTGTFTGKLTLRVTSGETKQIALPLSGTGYPHYGIMQMSRASLDVDTATFCKGEITLHDTIRNLGCDTLFLTPAQLSGIVNGGADTSISLLTPLPPFVLPGDSTIFTIRFGTNIKGIHTDTIRYQYARNSTSPMRDTSVWIAGTIIPGESYMVPSITSALFEPMYVCESSDTTFEIVNNGCDTLVVDSIAFDNKSFTSQAKFPIIISPKDSVPLTFHIAPDTVGAPAEILGKLFIYSKAVISPIDTIPLNILTIIYPEHVSLAILQNDSATAGTKVTYTLVLTGGSALRRALLDSVTFDLTHDDDLLSYVDTTIGAGLTVVSGPNTNGQMTQHFKLSPVPASDTIGTLTFKVYLAKSLQTSLALSNILLGNAPLYPNDCIATLDSAGSQFTYISRCGDNPMRELMQSGAFIIDNITPNPAQSEIHVRVVGGDEITDDLADPGALTIKLYDALGRVAIPAQDVRGTSLHNVFSLHVSGVPEGEYYLRLSGTGGVVSRKVVILR